MKKFKAIGLFFLVGVVNAGNSDRGINLSQLRNSINNQYSSMLDSQLPSPEMHSGILEDNDSHSSDLLSDVVYLEIVLQRLSDLAQVLRTYYQEGEAVLSGFINILEDCSDSSSYNIQSTLAQASWTQNDLDILIEAKKKLAQPGIECDCGINELNDLLEFLQKIQCRRSWVRKISQFVNIDEECSAVERLARDQSVFEIRRCHDQDWASKEEARQKEKKECTDAYVRLMYLILRDV